MPGIIPEIRGLAVALRSARGRRAPPRGVDARDHHGHRARAAERKWQGRVLDRSLERHLEERYENHAGYVKAVTKAAQKLGKEGFLLPADVQKYIDEAQASAVLR